GQPVDLGQTKVENRRVIVLGRSQEMAVLAIGSEIDRIAVAFERGLELRPQRGLVLDNQNPHSGAFQPRPATRRSVCSSLSSRNDHRKMSLRDSWATDRQGLRPTIRPVRAST